MNNDYNFSKSLPMGNQVLVWLTSSSPFLIKTSANRISIFLRLLVFLGLFLSGYASMNAQVSAGTYGPFCEDGPMETLIGSPTGGNWSTTHIFTSPLVLLDDKGTTAIFDPKALGAISTSVTVTVTYTPPVGAAVSTNIIVNPKPSVSITSPTLPLSVCENDVDITLIGSPVPSGTATGTWTGMSVTDDLNLVDANAVFDPSGENGDIMVTYTYTDINGCSDFIAGPITVYNAAITTPTNGSSYCENTPSFLLIGTPLPNLANQKGIWSGPGVTATDDDAGTAMFDPSLVNGDATITYTFQDGTNGCSDIATITVTVNETPTVDDPGDFTLCPGETFNPVFFTGSAVPGTVYDWVNDDASSGLTTMGSGSIPSFTATNTSSSDIVSTISVTPKANGCSPIPANAMTFTITVKAAPPIMLGTVTQPSDCGSNGEIQITNLTASFDYVLSFKKDGTAISNNITTDGSGNFVILDLSAAVYSEIKINDGICTSEELADVTLSEPVKPTVNAIANQVLCPGESTTLVSFTGTADSYTWIHDNPNIGLPTTPGSGNIASFTALNAGTSIEVAIITVTPKNTTTNTCEGTPQTFSITVNPNPTLSIPANQVICAGENFNLVDFVSTPSGATFDWTNDDISIGLASSGQGDIAAFQGLNTGLTPVTATVSVTPTLAGCSDPVNEIMFTLGVNPIPTVTNPGDQSVCVGESVSIDLAPIASAGGAITGVAYNWESSNAEIGLNAIGTTVANATAIAFNATNLSNAPITSTITITPVTNSCEGTPVQFTITVNPIPTVDPIADQMVCEEEASQAITFTGSNISGTTYKWEKQAGQNAAIGLNDNDGTLSLPSFITQNSTNASQSVMFDVIAEANGCASNPESFEITVNPKPVITDPVITDGMNIVVVSPFCADQGILTITGNTPITSPPSFGFWSGPGISNVNGVTGKADLDVSNLAETVTLTYEFTDDNGCRNTKDFNIFVRNSQPSIPDLGPFCATSGVQTFTGNPIPNVTIGQTGIWDISANTGAIGTPTITNTTTPGQAEFDPVDLSGDFTLSYAFTDEFGCEVTAEKIISIGSPNIIPGSYGPVCENGTTISLAGMPVPNSSQGETSEWTGPGISSFSGSAGTGVFDPTGLSGIQTITYTISNTTTGCTDSKTTDIMVNLTPIVDAGTYSQVCEDATLATGFLVGSPNPSDPGGVSGKWEGPNLSITDISTTNDSQADFNPSGLSGSVTLSYTFVDNNGCSATDEAIIQVNPVPVADAGPFDTLCVGVAPVLLTGKPTLNAGETGTWSGTGIDGTSVKVEDGTAMFDPTGLSGNITLTYTFVNDKSCTDVATTQYTIQALPNVVAGPNQSVCESAMPITLTGNLLTANQTGVWSGSSGVVDGGDGDHIATFNPSGLIVNNANTVITLTFTVTDEHGCESSSDLEVTILPIPMVDAGTYSIQCQNATISLEGSPNPNSSNNLGSSSWSVNGSVITSNSNAGTASLDLTNLTAPISVVYAYTDGNACTSTDTTIIETLEITATTNDTDGAVCQGDEKIELTGTPRPVDGSSEIGLWSSPNPAHTNAVEDLNNGDDIAYFYPDRLATSVSGPVTLRYTFTDANGCEDMAEVVIMVNELPMPTVVTDISDINGMNEICVSGAAFEIRGEPVPAGIATGTWTGTGIVPNTDNNGKAMFDPAIAGASTHTLLYTYTDINGCKNEMSSTNATTDIIVNPLPVLVIDAATSTAVCIDGTGALKATPANASSNWTGPGVSNILPTAGTADIDATVAGIGTHTYTYTYEDAEGCSSQITTMVTVNPNPVADAGMYDPICAVDSEITLTGSPTPSNGGTGTWSGTGVIDDDTNDQLGKFNPTTLTGNITLTYTFVDDNGCSDVATTDIEVKTLPVVSNSGDPALCENEGPMTLTINNVLTFADGEQGIWTGSTGIDANDDTNDNAILFDPSGLDGEIDLTYTYTNKEGCSASATKKVTVNKASTIIPGTYPDMCKGGTVTLTGSPNGGVNSGIWTSNGGTLSLPDEDAGTVMFSPNGSDTPITLTYSYTNPAGCTSSETVEIGVNSVEATTDDTDGAVCQGDGRVELTGSPRPADGSSEKGVWSSTIHSIAVEDLNDADELAFFYPDRLATGVSGPVTLIYTFTDANGCEDEAEVVIMVNELPTPTVLMLVKFV